MEFKIPKKHRFLMKNTAKCTKKQPCVLKLYDKYRIFHKGVPVKCTKSVQNKRVEMTLFSL